MSNRIYIFDTTLRDGEQSPGVSLNIEEKVEIAQQLKKLGVDIIEAGFPVASPGDFNAVKAIAAEVRGPVIAGLVRAIPAEIDRTWEALKGAESPRIHTFLATSDIHMKFKLQRSREQVLEQAVAAVKHAKKLCPDVEFSAEDAYRSDMKFLAEVVRHVIDAGATVVNLPDTVGYAVPDEFYQFITEIISRVDNIDRAVVSLHNHNDLGLAVANSLAGIRAGARQVECAINGIGERAGNASLEELVMALYTRHSFYDKTTGIKNSEIYRTSRLVSDLTGMSVQPNKAIVGKNAFSHESGIHQDGVMKERSTYEIMSPELLGITANTLVLGKLSGRHAFAERLEELGIDLTEEELKEAFARFKEVADRKKEITNDDLIALVRDQVTQVPERFSLEYMQVMCGTGIPATATVKLSIDGKVFAVSAIGAGPVEAACHAIDKITDIYGRLKDFKVLAVGSGKDALGEVVAGFEIGGKTYAGRGLSTDIVEASAKAYVNAINKHYHDTLSSS